jgi:CMP/dCMP kinase
MKAFNQETEMPYPKIITIDGPAASGKTTLGKLLADELGYLFFDTGVMYRAVTWAVLDQKINANQEAAVSELAQHAAIDVLPPSQKDGRSCDIQYSGKDITWEIRSTLVEANVSVVSTYSGVREAMTLRQRQIGLRGKVVMVGRDIGTVVLPEADFKVFLEASAEERALRRTTELIQRAESANYASILQAMKIRDRIDSTRTIAPLKPAHDAIIINTDNLAIDQVFYLIKQLAWREATAS